MFSQARNIRVVLIFSSYTMPRSKQVCFPKCRNIALIYVPVANVVCGVSGTGDVFSVLFELAGAPVGAADKYMKQKHNCELTDMSHTVRELVNTYMKYTDCS